MPSRPQVLEGARRWIQCPLVPNVWRSSFFRLGVLFHVGREASGGWVWGGMCARNCFMMHFHYLQASEVGFHLLLQVSTPQLPSFVRQSQSVFVCFHFDRFPLRRHSYVKTRGEWAFPRGHRSFPPACDFSFVCPLFIKRAFCLPC